MDSLPIISNLSGFLKQPSNVEFQLLKLMNRGLLIEDIKKAEEVLLSTNYYYFTGYLHHCKELVYSPSDSQLFAEVYNTNLTFNNIHALIVFDSKLRSILMYAIDYVERDFKTKIAYYMAQSYTYGNVAYLYADNFKDKEEHEKLMEYFKTIIYNNRKTPIVKHHESKYEGYFPVWVAVELMTLGNIEALYGLLDNCTNELIAKDYKMKVSHLKNHLMFIRKLRNMIVHNSRLYKFRVHPIPSTRIKYKSEKVFDSVVSLKEIYSDKERWNSDVVSRINSLFEEYNTFDTEDWGFPLNWKDLLNIK